MALSGRRLAAWTIDDLLCFLGRYGSGYQRQFEPVFINPRGSAASRHVAGPRTPSYGDNRASTNGWMSKPSEVPEPSKSQTAM